MTGRARPLARWSVPQARAWAARAGLAGAALALLPPAAHADSQTTVGSRPRTATVSLRFQLSIDQFLFFRIGDGSLPSVGGTVSTVSFVGSAVGAGVPASPVDGSQQSLDWTGAAPNISFNASNNVLPVEVRSNAGQVSLRATVQAALSSGSNTLAMSNLGLSSSDAALPAPPLPASGTGTSVNVTPGGAGAVNNLVTLRSANWTFSLAAGNYPAGTYNGQLLFTASTP